MGTAPQEHNVPAFLQTSRTCRRQGGVRDHLWGGHLEAQEFTSKNNVTVVNADSPTVNAVGGWALFSGHSVLSPTFGLGADRLLEIEIVAPDGRLRTCNTEQNADLLWALRGAGGGEFGVVLRATVKVEPAIPVTFTLLSFTPTSENLAQFLFLLINNTATWSSEGWGGTMSSSHMELVNPLLDVQAANKSSQRSRS